VIKQIPMFGLGLGGKSPNVSAMSRTNLYCEIQYFQDKTQLAIYPLPGKVLFTDLGATPIRGAWVVNNFIYFCTNG